METITFEQLPLAVALLHEKLDRIEQLLQDQPAHQPTEELFNIKQASAFLNMSIPTIYCKVSSREIPANKRGRRLYFYKSELEEWIRGGRRKTMQELQQEASLRTVKKPVYRR